MTNLKRIGNSGHTLLELVVCLPVMTLLIVAIATAIGVARRSLPEDASPNSATLVASAALDQFAIDVMYATEITKHTPTELILTVADRNGDSNPESIRYHWAGQGKAFTREINGSPLEPLAENVQQLSLAYETRLDESTGRSHLNAVAASLTMLPTEAARYDGVFRALNSPVLP